MLTPTCAIHGAVRFHRGPCSGVIRSAQCSHRPQGIHWIYTDGVSDMATNTDSMLLKFREKDTKFGVTRDTVRALANELQISETLVVHMALSRFAEEMLPAYQPDDGPLTARQLAAMRKAAAQALPKGKVINRSRLF